MRLKMRNRSHRYNINGLRPRQGHKYTKYKLYLSIMVIICIKKHLSNIWSSIYEKAKLPRSRWKYQVAVRYPEIFWKWRFGFWGWSAKGHNWELCRIIFSHKHVWMTCVGVIYYGRYDYFAVIICIRVHSKLL